MREKRARREAHHKDIRQRERQELQRKRCPGHIRALGFHSAVTGSFIPFLQLEIPILELQNSLDKHRYYVIHSRMLPRRTRLSRSHPTGLSHFSPAICRLFAASQNVISHRISSLPPLLKKTRCVRPADACRTRRVRLLTRSLASFEFRSSSFDPVSSLESVFPQNSARKSFGIRSYAKMPGCGIPQGSPGRQGIGTSRGSQSSDVHTFNVRTFQPSSAPS